MNDTDAQFEHFVHRSFAYLCRTGFLLCGDWHRAEDATQSALLRVHRRWRRIDDPEAYARRALVTILIDESRRPWRRETPQFDIRDSATTSDNSVEDRDELSRALSRLTPRRRACIVLRFYLDASVQETAKALGCSEGNVKRMTSDALIALRGILTPVRSNHG